MATTRCKFRLDKIEISMTQRQAKNADGSFKKDERGHYVYEAAELRTLVLFPVYHNNDPTHENTKFWEASPSGEFKLGVVNLPAVAHMKIDQEFYIDITPAA